MSSLVLTAEAQLEWRAESAPALDSPSAAHVRPLAVATCDFDHLMLSGRFGPPGVTPLGHECVARVLTVGAEVRSVREGDLVIVPFQISCGACKACLRGKTSACARVPWLSCYGLGKMAGNYGGMLSDKVHVPFADAMLVPLPAGLAPEAAAAIGCDVVDAYRCVVPALQADPGASVLIASGAFVNIGLYAVALAKSAAPNSRVAFYDPRPEVTQRAARLGAEILGSLPRAGRGTFDVTVDASMNRETLIALLRATAPGGLCTVSTMYPGETPLPLFAMFERCLTLQTGQPHARADRAGARADRGQRLRPRAAHRGARAVARGTTRLRCGHR